ncbi:protein FAR1-RELATED SEQUENCE 6-like [Phoenix dactylifera]|uniref:Protein FAR1-RELATED SEQUENCE n=1 Tax=Phoenix dactylifera TaxID=42345 RepID=A0A8B7BUS6_PHODC|nr:protein FAR1-RELATED SEQUENCE 6-like [Phoenix dactylifera]
MADESQDPTEVPPEKDVEVVSVGEPNAGKQAGEPEYLPEPEPGGDQKTTGADEGVPRVGMVFKTFEEVYDFYNQYARHTGFGTKIRRSWYSLEDGQCNKVTFTCCKEGKRVYKNSERCSSYRLRLSARTDCQAKIKVQKRYADGLFHLTEVVLEHNHPVNPAMSKYFRSHKDIYDGMKRQPVMRTKGQRELATGENEDESSAGKARSSSFLGREDVEALQQFLIQMQTINANFFHLMDFDAEGRARNVFWADGRSRAAYQYFGDVIAFDTSYLTGNFETPLASFVGVNHHGHLVLLGCALLSNRSSATYRWLFKAWLSCMSGVPPNAIITDHCKAIQEAVVEVFPGARHRLCLWHIMKRMQEYLGGHAEYKVIKGMMKKAVYDSLEIDEFEEVWKNMIEKYGLKEHEWLKSLYENRYCWVPAFVKDAFWAGMSTTQHKESMTSFFDGYIYPKTSIKQFLCKYETAIQSKYEKEIQADLDSFSKSPQLISKFYMEDQLRKIYTVDMFKKFQEEVKAILYCIPSLVRVDGPVSTFEVKEPIQMKDGNMMENRNYEVIYNSQEQDLRCICCSFQFRGIICRHALSVLNFLEMYEIPSQFILERWRKDYKYIHILSSSSNDSLANGPMERYNNIYKFCLKFAEVGASIDDNYEVVMKILSEGMEELIASDCLISDPELRTYTMNGKRSLINENDEIHDQVQVRRKGQPLKKRKESLVEKIVKTSKKKVCQRKPTVGGQSDILRIAPDAPQFDTPIWTQETISLTEQVNPTNLSIGSHFGVPVNHQHALDNQSGMRWSFQQMFQQAHTQETPPGPWAG